jgi:hypothetical protein
MVNSVTQLSGQASGQESPPMSLVMSYQTQRLLIGVLAMLLPVVVVTVTWLMGDGVQRWISGYYYTPMRNIFVGTLWALGVFLLSYHGYDLADRLITDLAGLCAICIALFPAAPGPQATARQALIGWFHLGFALTGFVALAVMSLRFASREPAPPGLALWPRLKYGFGFTGPGVSSAPAWELLTYRLAGLVILICVLLCLLLSSLRYSLLVLEWVLLWSFGISWFVKGRKILSGG